jgi:hypothetical protein
MSNIEVFTPCPLPHNEFNKKQVVVVLCGRGKRR